MENRGAVKIMAGIILRWLGGGGGDTIMNLLSHSNDVYTNIHATNKIDPVTGRSLISEKFDEDYPSFYDMSHDENIKDIDSKALKQDIVKLNRKKDTFLLKSHHWDKKLDKDICDIVDIVNIGYTIAFIPFIVRANLHKTPTLANSKLKNKTHFDYSLSKIAKKLTDKQHEKVVTWNIITDLINKARIFNLENATITIADIFYNRDHLKTYFQSRSLKLDITSDYLNQWVEQNKKFLPSKTFQNYIDNTNYNHIDSSLDMVERYTLLALSGKNFQFID